MCYPYLLSQFLSILFSGELYFMEKTEKPEENEVFPGEEEKGKLNKSLLVSNWDEVSVKIISPALTTA